MDLHVLRFLQDHPLEELASRYFIHIKRHGRFPSLVMLKYNQLNSPMDEPIVQECRGLILDEADGWHIVAFPYTKFFNYGEPNAAEIDWSTAQVFEKLDGSLMTLYWYAGQWQVASSGTPDASGPVLTAAEPMTFADLFWKVWNELGYRLPDDTDVCYMFELMTPMNRVVVRHAGNRIVLHGARRISTREELMDLQSLAGGQGWECVRSFPLHTLDEIVASAAVIDPMNNEGYVVRDAQARRLKVKAPQYVALAHLKDGLSARGMLDLVRKNERSEFLSSFPELIEALDKLQIRYDELCAAVEADFARLRDIPSQKDFAAAALQTRYSGVLFALRGGKPATARDYFAGATLQMLERTLGMEAPEG